MRVKCLAQEPRLPEIEKYKNQITGYLHRLLITFQMYNNNLFILIGTETLFLNNFVQNEIIK